MPDLPLTRSAIVLAGGRSSRMGQDKALIEIDGQPLLLQVCQVAQACVDRVYVVTPWVERYQILLAAAEPPIQLIQEAPFPEAAHGPLVGFWQGLVQLSGVGLSSDWVLLLACDLPNLTAEVLQDWSSELPQISAEVEALLPRNPQGWWEPLCGFYRSACAASLLDYIRSGGRSFQGWLADRTVQELPLAETQMLMNCNTPEELQQVQEQQIQSQRQESQEATN